MFEADLPVICTQFHDGIAELSVPYVIDDGSHLVRVDCVTETHAVETGLICRNNFPKFGSKRGAPSPAGSIPPLEDSALLVGLRDRRRQHALMIINCPHFPTAQK